jgi:putative transcriptional regulator
MPWETVEMKRKPKGYHYKESGLDNIYLVNGYEWVKTPRGKALKIEDVDGLHRAIGLALINEKKSLTGREFRFLRHELNLTQQAVGMMVGVDVQTVGRWERDECEVHGSAERLIKLLYAEKISENPKISELLGRLAELDEALNGDAEIELRAEVTSSGEWEATPIAA